MRTRLFGALILAYVALMAPTLAQAHAEYDHSDPATDATLPTAPSTVTVWFTEELVSQGSSLEVRDAANARVDSGNSRVVDSNPKDSMTIGLRAGLPNGTYTVTWKTVSADDGDEATGAFSFGVGVAPTAPAATTETQKKDVPSGPAYDVTGTVVSLRGNTMQFLTSDITGYPMVLRIDASNISRRNITSGDSLTLTIGPRVNDIPLAWTVVSQGSKTDKADFGARSEFETKNGSAEVFNRADDDEARAKDKDRRGKSD